MKNFKVTITEGIDKQITETRLSIVKTGLEMKMKRVKNTNTIKNLKKKLAQLLTAKRSSQITGKK